MPLKEQCNTIIQKKLYGKLITFISEKVGIKVEEDIKPVQPPPPPPPKEEEQIIEEKQIKQNEYIYNKKEDSRPSDRRDYQRKSLSYTENPFEKRKHSSPFLFVGNVSTHLKHSQLKAIFEKYGRVHDIELPPLKNENSKIGHIFVNYYDTESSEKVILIYYIGSKVFK